MNDAKEREEALLSNTPARFEIRKNRNIDVGSKLWDEIRTFDGFGRNAVKDNHAPILKYSKRHNIDPDLLRSVIYAENARGHYIYGNKIADKLKKSDSILPMNIQKDRWSSLIDKEPDDLYNSDYNIEAGAVLLRRISDRVDRATPEKVGSIWNYIGREKTNEFGEYVGRVYREKPWKKLD